MVDTEPGTSPEGNLPYGFSTENSPISPDMSPDFLADVNEEALDQTEAAIDEPTNPEHLVAAEDLLETGNIMTKMVVPHPIAITTEAVDNLNDVNIPGEITVSKSGKLLRNYLAFEGFSGDTIESYDHMLQYGIPTRLSQTRIDLLNGNYVEIDRVNYARPQTSTSTEDAQNLTPLMAREQGYTYASEIYADMVEIDGETGEPINRMKVRLGKIPVMLGSSLDHLRGLTERQRLELGECNKDPLGYFIIKGSEYIVLLREQLRLNRFLMFTDDDSPVCRMTCRTQVGTTIVTLSRHPKKRSVQLALHFLNQGTINVFQVYRMLGVTNPDQIFEYIRVFTKSKWTKKIWLVLRQTYIDYLQVGDDIAMISELRNETLATQGEAEGKTATAEGVDLETQRRIYTDMLITDLFPQIPKDQPNNKVYLLSMMIARYAENLAGLRPLDDRDSWSNKRVISAGPAMTQLFGWCWDKMVRLVNRAIEDATKKAITVTLKTVSRSLRPTIMTEDFEASFTTHNWGCKNGTREENYTDILKRGSLLDAYAHILQVKAPIDTKTKTVGVRMVHMSQIGFIDSIETPEGEGCGLIKAKAVTCWISVDRGEAIIRHYLESNVFEQPSQVASTVCILNGKLLGWCPGVALRDYLVGLRRNGNIAKDTMVLLDESDNILWLDTDGQRPTRPLLIVNPDTGVLLIEEKKLWGASFPKLLEEGCVEYIDSWEQEYIMLAQSVNDITARRDQLREAIENHERAQADVARVQGGTRLIRITQTEGPGNNIYRTLTADEYEGNLQEDRHEKHRAIEGLQRIINVIEASIKDSEATLGEKHHPDAIQIRVDEAIKQINEDIDDFRKELEVGAREIQGKGVGLQAEAARIQALTDPAVQQNAASLYNERVAEYQLDADDYQSRLERFQRTTDSIDLLYENARQAVQGEINKEVSAHETLVEQLRVMKERLISFQQEVDEPIKIEEEKIMTEADALEAVQLAAAVVRRLQAKKPYSHSEIDPNAILGVASSIIPLPDHNQAPRNTYQCLTGTSDVLCPGGIKKQIKDLKDGDTVITIDPQTHNMSETKIHSHFSIESGKNGKKVLEIEIWSGRKIEATNDHRFLTLNGWKEAGDLDTTTDHVSIAPTATTFENDCESIVILNKESFEAVCRRAGLKESLIEKYIVELAQLDYLPLTADDPRMPIIAKMLGFVQADGHVSMLTDSSIRTNWTFGRPRDAENFNLDVVALGFEPWAVCDSTATYKSSGTTHHTWNVHCYGAFAALFIGLGADLGRKTARATNPIPDWVMDGSKCVKQQFIAGFMGGDGCKINTAQRKYKTKDGLVYDWGRIVQHKHRDHIQSQIDWYTQFSILLGEFSVNTGNILTKQSYEDTVSVHMELPSDRQNIIRYIDQIGYAYATTKSINSHIVVEWLKYVENTISERTTLRKTISGIHDQGMTHSQLAKKFNVTVAQSQHFCKSYKAGKVTNLPTNSIRLEDWIKCVQVKGECIYVPIKSIKQIDDCMVYDFTTESDNHSFVAGDGFVTHNCGMGKQALGISASNHRFRFGTTSKMLAFPSRPLFETQMNKMIGLDDLPGGEMVVLAIMTYMGYNQEDAIIMNKGAIDRGLFRMVVYKSLVATKLKNLKINDTIVTESIERPPPSKGRRPGAYDNLDERGVARVGTILQVGDCAIGKVRIVNEDGHQRIEDASTYVKMGEDGIVDRVIVSTNGSYPVVKVKVRQMRTPIRGDKFASRHAQKSTVGLILPSEDMPFTAQGITPDIIMNPHAIPSRMTLGNLFEVVASKHSALQGERVNATAFNDFDIDEFRRSLTQYGYNEWGYETMYNGMTGKPFQVQIFIGPCYYQALKHHVLDKIQMRQRGAVQPDTRQPVGGRKHRGGIRFGEMERDALISHGAPAVLQERLCKSSDAYKPVFCQTCGTIAIANHISKQYVCRACGDDAQFGTCTIPYSFKLLTQLLAGAGIKISLGMAQVE